MFRRTAIAIAATTLLAAAPAGAATQKHAPAKPHGKPHPARVSAGATGQGPADQAECDRWADAINSWQHASDMALVYDDPSGSEHADHYVDQITDTAEDRGCFIVN